MKFRHGVNWALGKLPILVRKYVKVIPVSNGFIGLIPVRLKLKELVRLFPLFLGVTENYGVNS